MRRQTVRVLGALLIIALAGWAATPSAKAAPSKEGQEKIDINSADVESLTALPGIGKAYAQRIVNYREENGPFKRIEDLLNVRGIGEKTFEKIKDRITVGKK